VGRESPVVETVQQPAKRPTYGVGRRLWTRATTGGRPSYGIWPYLGTPPRPRAEAPPAGPTTGVRPAHGASAPVVNPRDNRRASQLWHLALLGDTPAAPGRGSARRPNNRGPSAPDGRRRGPRETYFGDCPEGRARRFEEPSLPSPVRTNRTAGRLFGSGSAMLGREGAKFFSEQLFAQH